MIVIPILIILDILCLAVIIKEINEYYGDPFWIRVFTFWVVLCTLAIIMIWYYVGFI